MSDYISRQAAIDALEREKSLVERPITETRWFDFGLRKAQDVLSEVPSAQRWIPCSERLPEEKDAGILKKLGTNKRSEYVLATVEVKGERMTVTACTYDGVWHWDKKYAFPDYRVTAWMPLPEPYRAERRTDE